MSNDNKRDEIPGRNKEWTIVINGSSYVVKEKKISYEKILQLCGHPAAGQDTVVTITFERGEHGHAEGFLSAGDSINIKSGMVFNVATTNKS